MLKFIDNNLVPLAVGCAVLAAGLYAYAITLMTSLV